MIDARIILVRVDALLSDGQQVQGACKPRRGQRNFIQQSLCGWIDVKIRISREIGGAQRGEVASAFRRRGNAEQLRQGIAGPLAVVIDEEECFVLDDWAAECGAELIFTK